MNQKSLFIYNASAGSGKTFKLVTQYLTILLSNNFPNRKFRSIAAMTFTNKAAFEMKERIIEYLYAIKKKDSTAKHVFSELKDHLKISETEISKRATIAFREILHSYEDFQVSTIDKFNLRLIKSFNRDLEISADFEVIIDEKEVHEAVVDNLMAQIGDPNNEELSKLLTKYAESNLEFGEQWNFKSKLVDFCEIINKEKNRNSIEQLRQIDFSYKNYQQISNEIRSLESIFIRNAQEIYDLYQSLNLDINTIPGKSSTNNEIEKLDSLEIIPAAKSSGSLFNDSLIKICQDDNKVSKLSFELCQSILALHFMHLEIYSNYALLKKFRLNFFNMALLKILTNAIDDYKKEKRIIRISDLNILIGNLVQNEEAPYIYEKIGSRLEHFLLDEFQDTSRLQWLNLIPLLHESISNERKNVIVGDPKQSIYRFNNGMAEQFVALPNIYNPLKDGKLNDRSKFFFQMGEKQILHENHRSCKSIVEFNNRLFGYVIPKLNDKAAIFYTDFKQRIRSKDTGFVAIKSFKDRISDDNIHNEVLQIILACQQKKHNLGEIAILTEKNAEGNRIAQFLTNKGISVVSNESILLKNSLQVRLVIYYIYLRFSPSNNTYRKRFVELFLKNSNDSKLETFMSYYILEKPNPNSRQKRRFNFDKFLNDHFSSEEQFFFPYRGIYNLAKQFVALLNIEELNDIYIHHLMDFIYVYEKNKGSDLKGFLDHYEYKKDKIALQLPESKDSVKILTIHKSKGLEFPIVIIPNLNFSVQIKNTNKQLIAIKEKIIYTNLKSESEITEVAQETEKELEAILIDKLNLAYVGLTRAKNKLFAFIPQNSKGLGNILNNALEKFDEIETLGKDHHLKIGKEVNSISSMLTKDLIKNYTPKNKSLKSYQPILLKSKKMIEESNTDLIYGIKFHQSISLFDFKKSPEDNYETIFKQVQVDPFEIEKLKYDIMNFYKQINRLGLNDSFIEVLSESSIIIDEKVTQRPDLIFMQKKQIVVVELKTGPIQKNHKTQLREYLKSVQKLDINDIAVKGYLYSTKLKEMISITL